MKLGDSGPNIKELQELLTSQGFSVKPDGHFGPATQKAVKDFQTREGLVPDGVVGKLTLAKLEGPKNHEEPVSFSFGKAYSTQEFQEYLKGISWKSWKPSLIVIHHAFRPSLAQRPNGLEYQHMLNLKSYYRGLGWGDKGPHLFVDDDQIWTYQPINQRGIHARQFNQSGIGIECLGNFDVESVTEGRGAAVIETCVLCVKALMKSLKLDKTCIRFHRDDKTTSKSCPGKNITKEWFLSLFD